MKLGTLVHHVHGYKTLITKNAPYSWGNFHACAITRFQKPQQLGRSRIACSLIITCAAEPDLSGQRCCKLRLKLLLVDQLAEKTWKLIAEVVTTKRLVCKNGHSLVDPPSRPACSIRYQSLHVSLSVNDSFKKFTGARSRRPHFSHGRQNRRSSFCRCRTVREEVRIYLVTIARFVKPLFANMHHHVHAVPAAGGPAEAKRCMTAPWRLHWMASVMMWSTLSSPSADATFRRPNGLFSFALFVKNAAIDLKCIENHGGKPWLTPQLAASCKWSSFWDCQGIFRIVARKDSRRLALDFQTLRPII